MLDITLPRLITFGIILLIVFPAHELAHALVATYFGDPTPRLAGRLTLNPFKHLNPVGSLLFLVAGIGWASTPINPAYFGENRRRKMGLVAVVGPFTNLVLAFLGTVPFYIFRLIPTLETTSKTLPSPEYVLTFFVFLNLLLAFFNLIPLAPLDGAQVVGAFLTGQAAAAFDAIQQYGMYLLILVIVVLPYLGFDLVSLMYAYLIFPILQFLFLGLG